MYIYQIQSTSNNAINVLRNANQSTGNLNDLPYDYMHIYEHEFINDVINKLTKLFNTWYNDSILPF